MDPSGIAQALYHIASKIQNSKNPDRTLVARDLKKILAALNSVDKIRGHEIEILPDRGEHTEILGKCRKCGVEVTWDDGIGNNEDGTPYELKSGESGPEWNKNHPSYLVPTDDRRPGMWMTGPEGSGEAIDDCQLNKR
jgi:hypothetical protein